MEKRNLINRPNGPRCPDCGGPVVRAEGRVCCVICRFGRR